jgi:hypothetical protein
VYAENPSANGAFTQANGTDSRECSAFSSANGEDSSANAQDSQANAQDSSANAGFANGYWAPPVRPSAVTDPPGAPGS